MRIGNSDFDEIWLVDFEFNQEPGENPIPICVVAKELATGKVFKLWRDEMGKLHSSPYPTDASSLIVAYYASAEIGCHLALGWGIPVNILDLYVEFRNTTNGKDPLWGASLIGALTWFGLDAIESSDKEAMRELAMRGEPYTQNEKQALLDYCESDVDSLIKLLNRMIEEGIFDEK